MTNQVDNTKINEDYKNILRSLLTKNYIDLDVLTFESVCKATYKYSRLMHEAYGKLSNISIYLDGLNFEEAAISPRAEMEYKKLTEELGLFTYYLVKITAGDTKKQVLVDDLSKAIQLIETNNVTLDIITFKYQPKIKDINQVYVKDSKLYTNLCDIVKIIYTKYYDMHTQHYIGKEHHQYQIHPKDIDI